MNIVNKIVLSLVLSLSSTITYADTMDDSTIYLVATPSLIEDTMNHMQVSFSTIPVGYLIQDNGAEFVMICSEERIKLGVGIVDSKHEIPLAKLNAWNRQSNFTRAYKDANNVLVVEAVLSFKGGTTQPAIMMFYNDFRNDINVFMKYMSNNVVS